MGGATSVSSVIAEPRLAERVGPDRSARSAARCADRLFWTYYITVFHYYCLPQLFSEGFHNRDRASAAGRPWLRQNGTDAHSGGPNERAQSVGVAGR